MKNSTLAIALLSLVLLAGCTGQQPADTGGAQEQGGDTQSTAACDGVDGETHTVTYTQNGFTPQDITVEQCDTVTWESEGPRMWVASDRHPTHTDYDGTTTNQHCDGTSSSTFDACEPTPSYSFTFDKTGEWGYHNHVRAAHGGTVVVR